MIFCGAAAYAQIATTPFLSKEGLSKAESVSKDSLGAADGMLTTIISADPSMIDSADIGSLPFTLGKFDMETGKASAWVYSFYSPSKMKTASALVAQLPFVGFQAIASTDSLDSGDVAPTTVLDVSGDFANSDKLVQQVKANPSYQSFHTQYPDVTPSLVMLRNAVPEDAALVPNGFPLDAPLWMMTFNLSSMDDALVCFVASKTGATFCQAVEIPSGVEEEHAAARATIAVTPNPSMGRTRVAVALPSGIRSLNDVSVELYDVTGRKVMDLTESFKSNGLEFAEFDASTLTAGLYYCRATGSGWHGVTGVVVQK